jgi:subtilisin family serine protease
VITVQTPDKTPLKDAEVYLFGSLAPASAVTDSNGQVKLSLYGETADSIRSLYVKPKADFWSFYQIYPDLSAEEENLVVLRPISEERSPAGIPREQSFGWGQKAMRLDQLPENYRGQGVKIAVIDSGAATSHDDLRKIRFGFDVINKKTSSNSWNEDSIAHGSHCAGLIAGSDGKGGIRGFAPDAEVHVCKLFPGGRVSQLIDALEYCVEQQIDVVNLSLGGIAPSEILEQQIMRAKRAGVACIVAAGNSGGRVQYPATLTNVLAVSAIGKLNEFPADSYHVQTVTPFVDGNGFFSARFTCFGPEIAVCAPGVAIVSSVPPNNYAVLDGTSTAAPHVTGLAALVLAHHPDFQGGLKTRSAERVDRLFQILKLSARSVNLGDPSRVGFGLPDVLVAVGLQPQAGAGLVATAAPYGVMPTAQASGGQPAQIPAGGYVMNPIAAMWSEQGQRAPQIWFQNPLLQGTPSIRGTAYGATVDPAAYAAYMQVYFGQSPPVGMPFGYGAPLSSFGQSGW